MFSALAANFEAAYRSDDFITKFRRQQAKII